MDDKSTRYRMLALDVDGTIAGPDHTVNENTCAAIHEAVEAGVAVVIATGRMRRSALKYADICGINGPTVCYGGAITVAPDRVTDIHHERLSHDVVGLALDQMRATSAHINMYIDDEIFVEKSDAWAVAYAKRMSVGLKRVDSLDEVAAEGPTVVMAVDEPDRVEALSAGLRFTLGTCAAVTQTLPRFCEVASPNAVKDFALRRVARELGISPEEVIAAGDGLGDISMLKWAGMSVSIEGAHPDAVAVADTIVASPEHDGVAELIRDLLRRGKLGD